MPRKKSFLIFSLLVLSALVLTFIYLTYQTYGNWSFALLLRGRKVWAFALVALALSSSTLVFQTLTKNQLLTPGVLGLDSLYVFVQTLIAFLFGGTVVLTNQSLGTFALNLLCMVILSLCLIHFFIDKITGDVFLLLMVGMVSSTFFTSSSTFLQVMMDPNEYELLQGKLFASFSNVSTAYLLVGTLLIGVSFAFFWYIAPELDVLRLGYARAFHLGVHVRLYQQLAMFVVALLTGTATALVGPAGFLGFIVVTITYRLLPTYRHRPLFMLSFLVGFCLLLVSQLFVEHIFQWNMTINPIIQLVGGSFFLLKILMERKDNVRN